MILKVFSQSPTSLFFSSECDDAHKSHYLSPEGVLINISQLPLAASWLSHDLVPLFHPDDEILV